MVSLLALNNTTLSASLFKKLFVPRSKYNQPGPVIVPVVILQVEVVSRLSQRSPPDISNGVLVVLKNSTHSFPSTGSETNSFILIKPHKLISSGVVVGVSGV